jgi:hypothetical protein
MWIKLKKTLKNKNSQFKIVHPLQIKSAVLYMYYSSEAAQEKSIEKKP